MNARDKTKNAQRNVQRDDFCDAAQFRAQANAAENARGDDGTTQLVTGTGVAADVQLDTRKQVAANVQHGDVDDAAQLGARAGDASDANRSSARDDAQVNTHKQTAPRAQRDDFCDAAQLRAQTNAEESARGDDIRNTTQSHTQRGDKISAVANKPTAHASAKLHAQKSTTRTTPAHLKNSGRVILVGAGPGDPELLTLRGARALAEADIVLHDELVAPALLTLAPSRAPCINVGRRGHASAAHTQRDIIKLLLAHARAGKTVVRLKGGDPYVFGRGGEEASACAAAGVRCVVVPGISSAQGALAYAGVPVTDRRLASSFAVVSGHRASDDADGDAAHAHTKLDDTNSNANDNAHAHKKFDDASNDADADANAGASNDANADTNVGANNTRTHTNLGAIAREVDTLVVLMGVRNVASVVAQILAGGRAPDTPAAVVSRATTPAQRSVRAPLARLPQAVTRARLAAPAVLVVGEVVRLQSALAWFERLPLFGRRVLVTRRREQAGALTRALAAAGAQAVLRPMIQTTPLRDTPALGEALATLAHFEFVVLSSANAAHEFAARAHERGVSLAALSAPVFALGHASARAAQEAGLAGGGDGDDECVRAEVADENVGARENFSDARSNEHVAFSNTHNNAHKVSRVEISDARDAEHDASANTNGDARATRSDARAAKHDAFINSPETSRANFFDTRATMHPRIHVAGPDAAGLLRALLARGGLAGRRVLLPRAERGRALLARELTRAGARVLEVPVYRTEPAPFDARALTAELEAGALDALTFASPSAVRSFAQGVGVAGVAAAKRVLTAVIGEQSAAAARALGLAPVVAASPETGALIKALEKHFEERPQ